MPKAFIHVKTTDPGKRCAVSAHIISILSVMDILIISSSGSPISLLLLLRLFCKRFVGKGLRFLIAMEGFVELAYPIAFRSSRKSTFFGNTFY